MNTRSLLFALVHRNWRLSPVFLVAALALLAGARASAQNDPWLVDPELGVRTAASGLATPISMAFLGENDMLVLEKSSGRVQRVVNGWVHSTVLDLPVNSASERGLLGIALHPRFPKDPGVYLFWTESSTGADTNVVAEVPLLGNRVDRFVWNGWGLTYDKTLIRLRARQMDANQPERGNHNGGVLRFGKDKKLYILVGDGGRRGQMQNLPDGPGPSGNTPDDQFGGPEPDNAHLTGVILRLNDDGTAPPNNPFYHAGKVRGGEAGANLQKVFAYGVRNGFGLAVDPRTGSLWDAQNGDDSFSEINRVIPGANLGWLQVMGPLTRIEQYKEIETSAQFFGLQQLRWLPTSLADDRLTAVKRMYRIYDGGSRFGAHLSGAEENPAVATEAKGAVWFQKLGNGTLRYRLWATGPIWQATAAHIHLGGYTQNGPVVVLLFSSATPQNFKRGDLIAEGVIEESEIIGRPGFSPTLAELTQRLRDQRTYVNLHTVAYPGGEIRGQLDVLNRRPVSHYNEPEFSWKYEVAPGGIGFVGSHALGLKYRHDLIVGAAAPVIQGGHLFHLPLSGDRRKITVFDERIRDRVADNLAKYDLTESEDLFFGAGFGVSTDIQTGPNGNLYIVSLSHGVVYEIYRKDAP